ncbi:TPA: hypothetical protein SLG40_001603 [Serratia odorifera]|nr:hypothetical protein [Serratia odorifera]
MARKRRNYKQEEERQHPDSPDGLVVAAANNRSFGARLIGEFRIALAGARKNGRR